jgi:hypothetical protein
MAKTKVLGILGAPYCGSTVLDMVLSTHPDVQGAGELNYIANRWWNGANAASRVGCVECHAADRSCPVIPHGPVPVSQLHRTVARNAGVSWVVDGSKSAEVFAQYEFVRSADVFRYVVMVKQPDNAAASYIRHAHDGNPAWAPGAAATPRGDGIARQWCDTYERILAFCASRPHIVVRYERFAGDPAAELARVAELMELSGFDHRTYREAQHHGVSGNWRARHEKNPVALPASLAVGVPPLSPLAWRQMSETWERVTG